MIILKVKKKCFVNNCFKLDMLYEHIISYSSSFDEKGKKKMWAVMRIFFKSCNFSILLKTKMRRSLGCSIVNGMKMYVIRQVSLQTILIL